MHAMCELYVGVEMSDAPDTERERIERLLGLVSIHYPDERFAQTYARLLTPLARSGRSIATMDLLIATAAIVADAALITRNARHFSRITGLRVLAY